jgi:hypothetical protein
MTGHLKRRALIGLAVVAVLVGGILAIVTGSGSSRAPASPRTGSRPGIHGAGRGASSSLALAAGYLDISRVQLRHELRTGATLAHIANATSGKSAAGLIDALIAAKASRLTATASYSSLSKTQQSRRLERLRKRVTTEVERAHGASAGGTTLATATSYLGITRRQIRSEQRAGRSIAQIADTKRGKSATGVIDALVKARTATLASELAAGTLTHAGETAALGTLRQRVTAEVNRTPTKHKSPTSATHAGSEQGLGSAEGEDSEAGGAPEGESGAG